MGCEKVDFKALKAWLSIFKDEDEVLTWREKFLKKHKNLSEKQVDAITRIFSERIDQIDAEKEGREYWDDKEAARREGWIVN